MKVSLYLDEDSSAQRLAQALRAHGVDAVITLDVGMARRSDAEQLTWAATQGRVIYTFNKRDFFRLHAEWLTQGRSHGGIVIAQQQQFSVGEQLRRLLKLIDGKSAEEMKDQVEFLGSWG